MASRLVGDKICPVTWSSNVRLEIVSKLCFLFAKQIFQWPLSSKQQPYTGHLANKHDTNETETLTT